MRGKGGKRGEGEKERGKSEGKTRFYGIERNGRKEGWREGWREGGKEGGRKKLVKEGKRGGREGRKMCRL